MRFSISVLIALFFLFGCNIPTDKKLILVSKDNHQNINKWLSGLESSLIVKEVYRMSSDSIDFLLPLAKGIVIGGGEDVNPGRYNKPEYAEVCGKFDEYRDTLEIKLIEYAMKNKVPLLGICRGHQIINVANGGSLIPDIPTFTNTSITHNIKQDYTHKIGLVNGSWLSKIIEKDSFMVNSRHHQAVDEIAPGFLVAAYASDSIIESIVLHDSVDHPFAAGVQWHPESLRDSVSNLIGRYYIDAVLRNEK